MLRTSRMGAGIASMFVLIGLMLSQPILSGEERSDDSALPGPTRSQSRAVDDIEYAIITTEALRGSFEPLADWRELLGLRTEIYVLDGDEGVLLGEGRDDAERLFNFIASFHTSSGGRLRYVLLGGDSEVVPVRYLHAGASEWDMDDGYLSDVYYSSPGTDWDRDGDKVFGEREDIVQGDGTTFSFDIRVGRVPASTAEEASRFVERTIAYEKTPEPGPWTSRFVLSSSLMDCPNILNDPGTSADEGYDAYKDNGLKAIQNYTLPFVPRSLDLIEVSDHPFYEGGNYVQMNDTLGFDTLPDLISEGCSLLTYAGQSFYDVDFPVTPPLAYSLAQYIDPQGFARGGGAYGEALTYEDVDVLDNGGRLPVVYLSCCDSANFSDPSDRDLSNMVLSRDGGAICLIGPSGVTWRGEGGNYSLGNWYLMSRYWQQFMGSNRPGDALYDLKSHYLLSKWDEIATKESLLVGLYAYNFLGDPAMEAWMGAPLTIGTVSAPVNVNAGGGTIEVEVRSSSDVPIYGASVAITMSGAGEVFKATTGPDGIAKVLTNFSSQGRATISVKARNHIPFLLNISVLPKPMDVELLQGSFQIGPLPLSEGRAARAQGMVRNNGDSALTGVSIGFYTIDLSLDPTQWGDPLAAVSIDLPPGGMANFGFDLAPDRSWRKVSIGAIPVEGELTIENNVISSELGVNARPRFLPLPILEFEEDDPLGGSLGLSTYVYDPDGSEGSEVVTIIEGAPQWVRMVDEMTLMASPPANWSGSLRLGLIVSDGLSNDTSNLQVNVIPVNDPPVIIGLPSRVLAYVGTVFILPLDIRDAEGDSVSVEAVSSLSGLNITSSTLRFLPGEPDVGMRTVHLNATDFYGASSTSSLVIEVKEARDDLYFAEPSIHLPDAKVGEKYDYTVKMGGELAPTTSFSDNTSLFEIGGGTGRITFTPGEEDVGEHWVKITAASGNTTVSKVFILRVVEADGSSMLPIYIAIGVVILLAAILVTLLVWKGPRTGQYGLEE